LLGSGRPASWPPGPGSPPPCAARTAPSDTATSPSRARPGCAGSCARRRRPPKRSPEFAPTYQAAGRRGKKIATTAIARKLLTRVYHLLTDAENPAGVAKHRHLQDLHAQPRRRAALRLGGSPHTPGRARTPHEPTGSTTDRGFLAADDPPPLVGVKLVRPRLRRKRLRLRALIGLPCRAGSPSGNASGARPVRTKWRRRPWGMALEA
jgi:hypothetical protein